MLRKCLGVIDTALSFVDAKLSSTLADEDFEAWLDNRPRKLLETLTSVAGGHAARSTHHVYGLHSHKPE